MVSYAQNHEDVVLARAFDKPEGLYIDVGAGSPVIHSVTNHFYKRGWRGINVEPLKRWHRELVKERRRDVNLAIGLSDVAGERDFFDVSAKAAEESTFAPVVAEALAARGVKARVRKVAVSTLAAVCDEHVDGPIDFLKVDVEGLEFEVLRGGDWDRYRPAVVVVESTIPGTAVDVGEAVWELMRGVGYSAVLFDGLNRFYVQEGDDELRELVSTPANVTDRFEDAELAELRASFKRAETHLLDSKRSLQEVGRRAGELEQERGALEQALDTARSEVAGVGEENGRLEARLECARQDVANARRQATDAEVQFRATREALERLLAEPVPAV